MKKHLVVALAYDQLCTFELGCVIEIFALKRPELNIKNWYQFAVASDLKRINATGGLVIDVPNKLYLLDKADTIIIPGWHNIHDKPSEKILKKIRAAYKRGARLCSICSGVFVLAAAGILKNKTVTTHWRYVDIFKKNYLTIKVKPDVLYVDEGQIMTSAGSAAGLDMLIYLIQKDYGAKIANQIAQRLVIASHRIGGQAQFIPRPLPPNNNGNLTKLMDWLRSHLSLSHTIVTMAKRAAMSPRTLQRKFKQTVGLSPYTWLIQERIALVKELLESTSLSIPYIAEKTGFSSEETLRHHFRRIVKVTPNIYRHQFTLLTKKYKT